MQVNQISYIDDKQESSINVFIRWDVGEITSLYFYHQSVEVVAQAVESVLSELLEDLSGIHRASANKPTTIGEYPCYCKGGGCHLQKDSQNTISFIGQDAEQMLLEYILREQFEEWL